MNKEVWKRMENGMKNAGYKAVARIHRGIGLKRKKEIHTRLLYMYPKDNHEWKWYTDHNNYLTLFVKEDETPEEIEMPKVNNEQSNYGSRIINRLRSQNQKGLDKYGKPLEDNVDLGYNHRLEHLAEELTDGLQYIEHFRDLINNHSNALTGIISELVVASSREYVSGKEIRKVAQDLNKALKELHGNVHK